MGHMEKNSGIKILTALLGCLATWALPFDPAGDHGLSSPQFPSDGPIEDSAPRLRFRDYQETYVKAVPFFEVAEKSGVKVQPQEVADRLKAYSELFPGEPFDASGVERLLKAVKYLASQGIVVSDRDVESRMSELASASATIHEGNREPYRQIIKAEILFAGKEIQQLAEKALEITTLRNQDQAEDSRVLWPLESLRLLGSPNECLATTKDGCWVTLEEYNAVLGEFRIPSAIPLDTAKATTLRKYLIEKQLARKGAFASDRQADSLIDVMRFQKAAQETFFQTQGMGRQVLDPDVLAATYDKYYRDLFKARTVATLGLIASSDSTYVDSLYRVLETWRKQDSTFREAGRKPPDLPVMPWLPFTEDALPGIIASHTDTLQPGEFGPPIATPFGHFLARVQKIRRIKEVSFYDAHPRLVFLATRDKFLGMDSVLTAKSLRYYRKKTEEFRIPDTLALTAWLIPFRLDKRGREIRLTLSLHPEKDTLVFSSIKISSLQLPWEMQQRLSTLIGDTTQTTRKKHSKPFLGPLKGEFGQWLFRVETVRRGGGLLPYETVKPGIVRKLASWKVEPDTLASDSVKQGVLLTLGLARQHDLKTFDKWSNMPAEAVERMIQEGEIDTAGLPRSLAGEGYLELARQRMARKDQESNLRTADTFMDELKIDYSKLFGP